MPRKKSFRAVLVRLDCGCEKKIATDRYRIVKSLAAVIVNEAVRKGVACEKHPGLYQLSEILGVVPLETEG